ncbi:GGDEF domain-containing protein [Paraglaciecola sp.]|uniref:GGDEF domain-containing protein n=1 Tax=Paraglaciecola sp. TaxID=1920173 RepID=UPI0030F37F06
MFIEKIRHVITVKTAFLIFALTLSATIIRPLIVEQSIVFTYMGIINSFALGCVFFYVKTAKPKDWQAMLLVASVMLVMLPIVLVSGGNNSHFSYLFPIIPIFVSLVSSAKYTWITTLIIVVCLIAIYFSSGLLPDYTYENVPHNKTIARTIWLTFSVLFACKFGIEFNRIISTLGNKLSEQAEIDGLTGIGNRRSIMLFLQNALDEAKLKNTYLSVLMIDLDHFKHINDNYGHLVGDQCLRAAALCLKRGIRQHTDQVGRYGGEEFIVIIKDANEQKAFEIAQQILLEIAQSSIEIDDNKNINITATIGLCTRSSDNLTSIEHFIKLADKALYQGKNSGRNCVIKAAS